MAARGTIVNVVVHLRPLPFAANACNKRGIIALVVAWREDQRAQTGFSSSAPLPGRNTQAMMAKPCFRRMRTRKNRRPKKQACATRSRAGT